MSDLWIEVDLDAIKHNYQQVVSGLSEGCSVMAVVKADAYGLGAAEVARALQEEGCLAYAVTTITEALALRSQQIRGQILVLGPSSPEDWPAAIEADIEITVSQLDWISVMNKLAAKCGKQAKVHIKIETGMGRTGFADGQLQELAARLTAASSLHVRGAYTHFARGAQRDKAYTQIQHERFIDAVKKLEALGILIPEKHVCNSAAYFDFPQYHYDYVRVGTLIIGHYPTPAFAGKLRLRDPWLAKTRIVHVQKAPKATYVGYQSLYKTKKETTLAVIPAGYADGFGIEPKLVPQNVIDLIKIIIKNTAALIGIQLGKEKLMLGGRTVTVAGKIGMQLTVLDVGEVPCQLGDEMIIPLRRTQANPRIMRIYIKEGLYYKARSLSEEFLALNTVGNKEI
ncbi:alanine racemase [Dehalobacter sp. DCM]|uniref:alanine racemase n=1 Tax=Dehalobacter sp. DCM TaxID=2907827 RepID=UPI0030821D6F|nr:alanine racemase [Dehalobacter sp. DCM]